MNLNGSTITFIVSQCTSLKELVLIKCLRTGHAKVRTRSLKRLKVHDSSFKFSNLLPLDVSGNFERTALNCPSLVDASLDLTESFNYHHKKRLKFRKLYRLFSHVKKLKLCKWCIQMLSILELQVDPAPCSKHTHIRNSLLNRNWIFWGLAGSRKREDDVKVKKFLLKKAADLFWEWA